MDIALSCSSQTVLGLKLLVILELRISHPVLIPCSTIIGCGSSHIHCGLDVSEPHTEMLLGLIHDSLMMLLDLIGHR
jgi:hypothetical protein